jgi:eukaryotic-like serine/threonine-protein kinase
MEPLSPERWAQIDSIFAEALDLPPERRPDFLNARCGQDRELHDAVLALLASEAEAGELIGDSVTHFASDLVASLPPDPEDAASTAMVGRIVGPYRIVAELGRGGMGAVYLAERADGEFDKRVALKLVKRGMDTDEILRRFHFERRILASLEHPNIARMYDGGASAEGQPYFVMELVEGETITAYCDARCLGIAERLDLFRSVCHAVQYAHQKLVVHRDIKPSNILVTADGTPKLLDFGIARLTGDDADDAPRTRTGMRILTPEYAAPEQLRGEPVTAASDVYALGAVLYELLSGCRPFGRRPRDTGDGAGHEPRDAAPPSSALSRPGVEIASLAAARSSTPDRLRRTLKGDLDTVVLKALAEEPALRYPSAQQLVDDLERQRAGLPIRARPAGLGYRAGKFVRRHRAALGTAAVLALSLVGGLVAALWQAGIAAEEREDALLQRAIAEDQRDAAEEVVRFLEGMFASANPFSSQPGRMDTMRIGAFLERGAERVDAELAGRPVIRARMQSVLGRAYRGLGVYDRAEPLLAASLDTYRSAYGDNSLEVAGALNSLGLIYIDRERLSDAERMHREALEIRRALLGPDHRDVAQSLNNLAAALQNSGRLDDAEALYDELLAIHARMDPPDSASWADALNTRMALAFRKDEIDVALPLARQILDINRALYGDAHPRVAQSMNNLAQLLVRTGAHEEAEPLLRESLAQIREFLGGEHPNIAAGAGNLAGVLRSLGRAEEAEPLYLEALAMNRRLLGDRHPAVAVVLNNYADLLLDRGATRDAERLYREALDINRAAFGPMHVNVGIVTARLAAALCRDGRLEDGRAAFREALATLQALLPPGHIRLTEVENGLQRCT